jgi:hypothetical protein
MSDDPSDTAAPTPQAIAKQRVHDLIGDFDAGHVTKPDAIRIRDRAARAVRDIDGYEGISRGR